MRNIHSKLNKNQTTVENSKLLLGILLVFHFHSTL